MNDATPTRRTIATGVSTAAVGAALAIAVWWLALRTHNGQLTDWIGFEGLTAVLERGQWQDIKPILDGGRAVALLAFVLTAVVLIVARRQRLVAVQTVVLVMGSTLTVLALNEAAPGVFRPGAVPALPIIASVDYTTTMFACAGIAVIMAVRPESRVVAALLTALVVGALTAGQMTSYGLRPSSFIVALLVAAMGAGLGVTAGAIARHRGLIKPASPQGHPNRAAVMIGLVILMVIGFIMAAASAILVVQWHQGTLPFGGHYGQQAITFVTVALAIGAAACLTAAAALAAAHVMDHPPASQPPTAAGPVTAEQQTTA